MKKRAVDYWVTEGFGRENVAIELRFEDGDFALAALDEGGFFDVFPDAEGERYADTLPESVREEARGML